jgi:hypothetical protein
MLKLGIRRVIAGLVLSTGCSRENSPSPVPVPTPAAPAPVPGRNVQADTEVAANLTLPTGCSGDLPARPSAPAPTGSTPVSDSNTHMEPPGPVDTMELAAFRTSEGKASRMGRELRIQLLSGRTAVFKDDTTPGMKFALPRYAGYLKAICSHAIHILQYEGSGAYLIVDDSTGDSTIVFGMPIVSPDAKRFAWTSRAGEANYNSSLIEVWGMVGRRPRKEFSFESETWEPSAAVWRDSATVGFLENTHSSPEDPYIQTPARLTRVGTTWILSASPH